MQQSDILQRHLFTPQLESAKKEKIPMKMTESNKIVKQSVFRQPWEVALRQQNMHMSQCFPAWLLEPIIDGNEECMEQIEKLGLTEMLFLMWKGLKCQKCSLSHTRTLLNKYHQLLHLILWYNTRKLASLSDYLSFYSLNQLLLSNRQISSSEQLFQHALKQVNQDLWQEQLKDYDEGSMLHFERGNHLKEKNKQLDDLKQQMYEFQLVFELCLMKQRSMKNMANDFVSKYIKEASIGQIQVIVKICHHSHQKVANQYFSQIIQPAIKQRLQSQAQLTKKAKSKLLNLLESSAGPQECLCLVHVAERNKIIPQDFHLRLPLTESRILSSASQAKPIMRSQFIQSQLIESSSKLQQDHLPQVSPKKISPVGEVLSQSQLFTSSFLDPSPKKPMQQLPLNNYLLQQLKILNIPDLLLRQSLLSQLEQQSQVNPRLVRVLFENWLITLQYSQLVQKVNQIFQKSSAQSKEQWRQLKKQQNMILRKCSMQ